MFLCGIKLIDMDEKKLFDKKFNKKVPFEDFVHLIDENCEYKFSIVDDVVDDELLKIAAQHGIDLKGYKHVIETSGVRHSEKRHGTQSNDRLPLSIEDYLLIPYIIRNRDKVEISTTKTKRHNMEVLVYEKLIGMSYYYVEEIRTGRKSLAFHTLYKRKT